MKAEIKVDGARLLPGTLLNGDGTLTLPANGGGVSLPELRVMAFRYLSFDVEALQEHSQAFELRFWAEDDTEGEKPRFLFRFGVMPNFQARVVFDMRWLDGHILFPGHTPGMLKTVCHGSRIGIGEIARAELVNCACHHDVRIHLSSIRLTDAQPRPLPIPNTPLVDEFGQLAASDWPGKTRGEEELKSGIRGQFNLPDAWPWPQWGRYGGYTPAKLTEGTGFFTKIRKDGRWHLADPDGNAFFSLGMDCVSVSPDCRVDGIEPLLGWIPAHNNPDFKDMYRVRKERWGEARRAKPRLFSYMQANLFRVFEGACEPSWRRMVLRQLKNAGVNTLGNWSDPNLFPEESMPYVTMLPRFPETDVKIFRDFPDVFSPQYGNDADECAAKLIPFRDEPRLIGWFLRNEPAWAFADGLIIADEVLRTDLQSESRKELIRWLREKYGSIAALNRAWKTDFADYEALNQPVPRVSALSAASMEDMRAFSRVMLTRYVAIPSKACRAADPNHMNLGMRWAWISGPDVISGWENFDVFSINSYALDPTAMLDQVKDLGVDLPVVIGEFHHGALDAGLTATGLKGVTSQKERGKAYRLYVEKVAAHPLGVGCHYFQCYDQFALGRFDGENYNIGLFDVCMKPHEDFFRALRECHGGIYQVRFGEREPAGELPETIPMIAY